MVEKQLDGRGRKADEGKSRRGKEQTRRKKRGSFAALSSVSAVAGNPLVKGVFTPAPAPFVHGDKVYMFTGHDENDAKFFKMKEWFVFESEDLVNWKSLGARQRQSRRRICITRTGVYPLNTCYFTPSRAGKVTSLIVRRRPKAPSRGALGEYAVSPRSDLCLSSAFRRRSGCRLEG